jgi:antitoxin (DNA-binding transcriptional repressor) of toxin-antitoxin stability system
MNATVLDLRKNMKNVLAALDRNEKVTLTYRGRKKAVIIPCEDDDAEKTPMKEHPAFGMWADREDMEDVHAYIRKIRKGRTF